jgi:hypothetical protein
MVHPVNPLLEQALHAFKEMQIADGENPYVGRALKGLLRQAVFSNILMSASYELFDDLAFFLEWLASCVELRGHAEGKTHKTCVRGAKLRRHYRGVLV